MRVNFIWENHDSNSIVLNCKDVSESIMFCPISQPIWGIEFTCDDVTNLGKSHQVWLCSWASHTDGPCSFWSSITSHTSLIIHLTTCTFKEKCTRSRVSDHSRLSLKKDRSTHLISVGCNQLLLMSTCYRSQPDLTFRIYHTLWHFTNLLWKITIYDQSYKEIIEIYSWVILQSYLVKLREGVAWWNQLKW